MRMTEKFMTLANRDKPILVRVAFIGLLYSPIAILFLLFLGLTTVSETRRLKALEADGVQVSAMVTGARQYRTTWRLSYTYLDKQGVQRFGEAGEMQKSAPIGSKIAVVFSASKPTLSEHNLPKLRALFGQHSAAHNLLIFLFLAGPGGLLVLTLWVRSIADERPVPQM